MMIIYVKFNKRNFSLHLLLAAIPIRVMIIIENNV